MKGNCLCCEPSSTLKKSKCPACEKEGVRVKSITLSSLLKEDVLKKINLGVQFYFCANRDCKVVYFDHNHYHILRDSDLKVPVGIKRKEEPIPVCYCFGIDRNAIWTEIKEKGDTSVVSYIEKKVREKKCKCVIKNPSGKCCLPEVKRTVDEGKRRYQTNKKKVLFICTHNSARSQMAEGLLRALYGNQFEVFSAGTEPTGVNPYAVSVLEEIGIDISHQYSKKVDEFLDVEVDYVITVCDTAKETCPFFPKGKIKVHRGFKDPGKVKGTEEEKLEAFRKTRDEIKKWIEEFFGNELKKRA